MYRLERLLKGNQFFVCPSSSWFLCRLSCVHVHGIFSSNCQILRLNKKRNNGFWSVSEFIYVTSICVARLHLNVLMILVYSRTIDFRLRRVCSTWYILRRIGCSWDGAKVTHCQVTRSLATPVVLRLTICAAGDRMCYSLSGKAISNACTKILCDLLIVKELCFVGGVFFGW